MADHVTIIYICATFHRATFHMRDIIDSDANRVTTMRSTVSTLFPPG